MNTSRRIAIIGSTGSIGCQCLEIIEASGGSLIAEVLAANTNASLLIEQAKKLLPNVVVIGDDHYDRVFNELDSLGIKVYAGEAATLQCLEMDQIDMVVNAVSGFTGLKLSIHSLKSGKTLALANKESLVAAGELMMKLSVEKNVPIIPIDSEPSAIMQCLIGEYANKIEKIILTASGGPFLGEKTDSLVFKTPEEALDHPVWKMGKTISVDSATMINKGWEMIEAKWLFNLDIDQIDVVIHPEALIHSMVQFEDGSVKAQLSLNDMKIPIQYALNFPKRSAFGSKRIDFLKVGQLNFSPPDLELFPCFRLAIESLKTGGNAPTVLLGANETAVQAFLDKKIPFTEIFNVNQKCLHGIPHLQKPTFKNIEDSYRESVQLASEIIATFTPVKQK